MDVKNESNENQLDVGMLAGPQALTDEDSVSYKKEVGEAAIKQGATSVTWFSDIYKSRQRPFWYADDICSISWGDWEVFVSSSPDNTIEPLGSDDTIYSAEGAEEVGLFGDDDVDGSDEYRWAISGPFYVTFYRKDGRDAYYLMEDLESFADEPPSYLDSVFDFQRLERAKNLADAAYQREYGEELNEKRQSRKRKARGATLIKDAGNVEASVARFNRIMTPNAGNTETTGSDSVSLGEDTIKQGNAWVNKGKDGTHGKFATKKAADDQRKAMFANGYKEDLNDDGIKEVSSVFPYTCGYITKDGTLLQCDEYHGEDKELASKGYAEYSNTHFEEDTCVRIYEKPTFAQYRRLERIIDLYLEQEGYCKVEVWKSKTEYAYYKAFSLYEGACRDPHCDETVGNWTGYKLVRKIKEFFDSVNESYPEPKKLYSIKDKKATWDNDAQDFIWWDSEARHSEKYATSYKVKMSPKEFLDLTTSKGADNLKLGDDLGFGKLKELDVDELNKEKRQPCFLIISFEESLERRAPDFGKKHFEADVVGHEGRHRMFALMNAGVEEIDVQLKITGEHYDKYKPYEINELTLVGQFNKSVKIILKNPIVMSWEEHKRVNPKLNAIVTESKVDTHPWGGATSVSARDSLREEIKTKTILNEMAMQRKDAILLCAGLGEQFINHFDKIYKEPKSQAVKHWVDEMQNWYNTIVRITLKPHAKKLDRTSINDWFLTVGSEPLEYLSDDKEVLAYDEFCNQLLISNSVQASLLKAKILNENINSGLEVERVGHAIDDSPKPPYNKEKGVIGMKNPTHLKDVVKNVSHIVLFNDLKDAHFLNFLSLDDDVDDIEDTEQVNYLYMTDEQLKTLSDEKIHSIDNIEVLDRLAKICRDRLSAAQIETLKSLYKQKVIVNKEDIQVLLDCIKGCDSLFIEARPKNMNFMSKHKLNADDVMGIIKALTVEDYCANTRSVNIKHLGDNLLIFEPVVIIKTTPTKICVYLKLDVDEASGDTVVFVSIHDADKRDDLPYGKKEEEDAGDTMPTNKSELLSSLGESIERHDTLNPKLWDAETHELKPEVKDKIDGIVKEFCSGLDDNEVRYKLDDVKLVGSNCSYNYTDKSDLDVHIVFDLSIYDDKEKEQMAETIYNYARSLWGKSHDIDFYGIPVEVFVETNNTVDLNADVDGIAEGLDVSFAKSNDANLLK